MFFSKIKKISVYLLSLLGAAAVGLQNYMAIMSLGASIGSAALAASKAGLGALQGIAIAFGGVCGGVVNLFINMGLLKKFFKRFKPKKAGAPENEKKPLTGWQSFSYWFGSAIFVCTGILFGLTAFAFGSVGALAALSIAAGILVAGIMTIQELETWLERFDDIEEETEPKSFYQLFIDWKNSLTTGKVMGILIAIGNTIALSLLFTLGLATFLTGVGAPLLPALISAFVVAFTAGAFTEFYFYHNFLGKFCENISAKWAAFKNSAWPVLGAICSGINAAVNGVLTYVGIIMLVALLAGTGVAMPPVGVIIAGAVVAAIFATVASFILGIDFWTDNKYIKKIKEYFTSKPVDDKKNDEAPSSSCAILTATHTDAKAVTIEPPASKPAPAPAPGKSSFDPMTVHKLSLLATSTLTPKQTVKYQPHPPMRACA